ncbi:hypothetical protein ACOMHN_005851 [Nucella lapillus]
MSLFADKWILPFNNNPFGLDDFHSTSFGEFRLEPNFSLFGKELEDEEDYNSLEMRLRNSSLLTEPGFYDHFDSLFHDRSRRYDLRAAAANSSRRSPQANGRGKEFVIPIKIETSPKGVNKVSPISSTNSVSASASSISSSGNSHARVIEIPIVRESTSGTSSSTSCSSSKNKRDKSRSPIVPQSSKAPTSIFTRLTPTTEENRNSWVRDTSNDVVLDSDAFFTRPRTDFLRQSSKPKSDIEIVDVEDEDSFFNSLRRKPLRHFQNTPKDHLFGNRPQLGAAAATVDSFKKLTSSKDDPEKKAVEVRKRSGKESEDKPPECSHPGPTDVTAAPSYPIYDYLMPKLTAQDRQIDYIRGDGNCFFRAISKDVYGSEEYHAECRQAVCDLIQDNADHFRQYIDDSSVTAHVTEMRVQSTWATTCEIYAAATLLGREIYVLAPLFPSSNTEYHWLLFSPRFLKGAAIGGSFRGGKEEGLKPCYVTLCHTNANHYDRITPVTARCNCQLAPPSLNGKSVVLDLTTSDL